MPLQLRTRNNARTACWDFPTKAPPLYFRASFRRGTSSTSVPFHPLLARLRVPEDQCQFLASGVPSRARASEFQTQIPSLDVRSRGQLIYVIINQSLLRRVFFVIPSSNCPTPCFAQPTFLSRGGGPETSLFLAEQGIPGHDKRLPSNMSADGNGIDVDADVLREMLGQRRRTASC